jgi:cytoskeletal protein RodZ
MKAMGHDPADVTIGIRLQLLREQKNLSLQQVSGQTYISLSNLRAIEGETYDLLPADIFVRGLVKIYGDFLGIDGAETARLYIQERDSKEPKTRKNRLGRQARSLAPKKLAEPSHISSATLAAILLLFIVASFTTFCLYTSWNPFAYFLNPGTQRTSQLTYMMIPGYENEADAAMTKQTSAVSTSAELGKESSLNPSDARPEH